MYVQSGDLADVSTDFEIVASFMLLTVPTSSAKTADDILRFTVRAIDLSVLVRPEIHWCSNNVPGWTLTVSV